VGPVVEGDELRFPPGLAEPWAAALREAVAFVVEAFDPVESERQPFPPSPS
jgi:hypothetical protein